MNLLIFHRVFVEINNIMPVEKNPNGGWRVHNTHDKKPMSKKQAQKQLAAIEIYKHMHESIVYEGQIYDEVQNKPSANDSPDDNIKGFFGKKGAGCLFLALNTQNICLGKRSEVVQEPGTWGTWGGKIDEGETPVKALERELREETGFHQAADYVGVCVFGENGFEYYNYLVVIPQEFQPTLNDETDEFLWTSIESLPQPLHFGLEEALPYYKAQIKKVLDEKA